MNNLHEVKLNLTDAQLKKLMKTTVQLSNVDVGHGQSFYVTKKVNTKIEEARVLSFFLKSL